MLPVVDKPLIQYAVEEAYAAGVREMIFVTGRHKRPIEDHFDMTFELEVALEKAGKQELLDVVHSVKPADMECIYVRQAQALGLGHAVLCGQRLVGNNPFAVLLADDLMVGEPPVLQQMVEQFADWRASILAVQEVPAEHTRRYGIVAGTPVNDRLMDVTRIVEKPAPEDAPSRLGVAGRYILTPGVFHEIANQQRGVGGEIQLTDGISRPAAPREGVRLPLRRQALRLRQQGRLPAGQRRAGAEASRGRRELSRVPARARDLTGGAGRAAPAGGATAAGRQRRLSRCTNSPASLVCSTSAWPVWRQKAWKSRSEPGSVATTFSSCPLSSPASAFLALRMGSGQFSPRVSSSWSASMSVGPEAGAGF